MGGFEFGVIEEHLGDQRGREGLTFCPKCDCASSPVGGLKAPGLNICSFPVVYAGINPLDDVNSE